VKKMKNRAVLWIWLLVIGWTLPGCQSVYYQTMEKVGIHKRDILVDRVESARDAQQEGKEQFRSALERFSSVLAFEGGELEDKYNQLNAEYEQSQEKADVVHDRIDAVEDVAEALFDEWQEELDQYTSANLRRDSANKLSQTRSRYKKMITAMRRAEKKMDPVLAALKDQVLYLKHNLNAKAILSLQQEFGSIKTDIAALIREMERSINEADAFIKEVGN
jgi:predicted  nucleic acid-binding Zn-ribbon protein